MQQILNLGSPLRAFLCSYPDIICYVPQHSAKIIRLIAQESKTISKLLNRMRPRVVANGFSTFNCRMLDRWKYLWITINEQNYCKSNMETHEWFKPEHRSKKKSRVKNNVPDLMSHVRMQPIFHEPEKNKEKINTKYQQPSYSSKVGKKISLASLGTQWKTLKHGIN